MKNHIVGVVKEEEWEPSMSDLVQFVAVELAICFYNISPTKYFKMQHLFPLMAPGGMGSISIHEYHMILDYCGRPKIWEKPETGKWKNPHLRYTCIKAYHVSLMQIKN